VGARRQAGQGAVGGDGAVLRRALLIAVLVCGGCFDFDALRQGPEDMSGSADGPGDGGGGEDGPPSIFQFKSSWPMHLSIHYGDHDKPPATLTFSHMADSAQCSHDDGVTWGACDSDGTLVFTPDDYDQQRFVAVKLSKSGFPDEIHKFKPHDDLPGLSFYHCDQVVTAPESAAAFYGRLAAGRVVCINQNVTITYSPFDMGMAPSTTGIFLDANTGPNLKILGTEANRPVFINTQIGGNQGGFIAMGTSVSGVVLSNLQVHLQDGNCISFENNGGNNEFSNLDLKVIAGGNDAAIIFGNGPNQHLYNVDVDAQNSPGTIVFHTQTDASVLYEGGTLIGRDDTQVVLIEGTSTSTNTLNNVDISQVATGGSPKATAVTTLVGTFTMNSGSVTTPVTGIDVGGGGISATGNLADVTVHAKQPIAVHYTSIGNFSGLKLEAFGPGITVDGAQLHLDNTVLERLDQTGAASPAIDLTQTCVVSSANNGNHFCDQNHAGANKWTMPLTVESGGSNLGNFDLTQQVNMGMVDQCP
jgi:hypothetical protein